MTADEIACPAWCMLHDHPWDHELTDGTLVHYSRLVEGLTHTDPGCAPESWQLSINRVDDRVEGHGEARIWLDMKPQSPAEARALGHALPHLADLAEQ